MVKVGNLKQATRVGTLLFWLSGCSPSTPIDPCPTEPPPAFLVTVKAVDGPLPHDTEIVLAYGGGNEAYSLGSSNNPPSVMFCTAEYAPEGSAGMAGVAGGAGAGGVGTADSVQALVCELWIEGAATLWVTGGEYPELEAELRGEANECGAVTVEEELILGQTDTAEEKD